MLKGKIQSTEDFIKELGLINEAELNNSAI